MTPAPPARRFRVAPARGDIGRRQQLGDIVPIGNEPGKSTGSRAACRCNLARNGPSPTTTSRAAPPARRATRRPRRCCGRPASPPTAVRSAPAVSRRASPSATHQRGAARRMKRLQVDAERDGHGVGRADAIELFARQTRSCRPRCRSRRPCAGWRSRQTRRAARRGSICAARRSRRSWEIITVVAPWSRPQRPSDRSVSRSDTSIRSGRSSRNNPCTRHGSTTRYPPVQGTFAAGSVIRRTPLDITSSVRRDPGTTSTTSWPPATYPAPRWCSAIRNPPERGP